MAAESASLKRTPLKVRSVAAGDRKKRLSTIRWTHDDYRLVEQCANDAGLSFGGYLRTLALGSPGPRAVRRPLIERKQLARLLGEVGKLGSNVNQIARIANTLREAPPVEVLAGMQADIAMIRAAVMQALERES